MFESASDMKTFQQSFESFIKLLNNEEIDYAVVGGVAYSEYAPPRATTDIDFMMLEDNYDDVVDLLDSNDIEYFTRSDKQIVIPIHSKDKGKFRTYDLIFAVGFAPEGPTVNRAVRKTLFNVKDVMMARPEDLVTLWCDAVSDGHVKAYEDAKMFLKLKLVNVKKVQELVGDIMGSDADKVLSSLLAGNPTYTEVNEKLVISEDLFQTNEEYEVAKAKRYSESQERRRQLHENNQGK